MIIYSYWGESKPTNIIGGGPTLYEVSREFPPQTCLCTESTPAPPQAVAVAAADEPGQAAKKRWPENVLQMLHAQQLKKLAFK